MQDYIFVDLQGFKWSNNEFIIKEFALATNEFTQVFLVKPPYPFSRLSPHENRHVTWLEKNYGILWREGFIDHREFKRIIVNYLKDKTIFVKGTEKVQWVKHLSPSSTVLDLDENQQYSFRHLYEKYCIKSDVYNCVHHKKMCALKNVICIKKCYSDNILCFSWK